MIKFTVANRVGEIVIGHASADSAFTGEMVRQLGEIMLKAAHEADIVTLKGEGADFSVGRDRQQPPSGAPFDAFRHISALNKAIAAFPGILIGGVRGRAFGLGVGLIMRSDIAIAAADAQFRLDEITYGIPPMFIMEEIVEHVPPKRAFEIILSGRQFDANEAMEMGLLSQTVAASRLDETVDGFVTALRGRDPSVVLACKRYMRAAARLPAEARSAFALVEQTQFALSKQ